MVSERVDLPQAPTSSPPDVGVPNTSRPISEQFPVLPNVDSTSRSGYPPYMYWNDPHQDIQQRARGNARRQQWMSLQRTNNSNTRAMSSARDRPFFNAVMNVPPMPYGQPAFPLPGAANTTNGSENQSTSESILRQMGQFAPYFGGPYQPLGILPNPPPQNQWNAGNDSSSHRLPELQRQNSSSSSSTTVQLNGRIRGGNPRPLHVNNHGQNLPNMSLPPIQSNSFEISRTGQPSEIPVMPPMLWHQIPNAMPAMAPTSSTGNSDRPHVTKLVLYNFDINRPHNSLTKQLMKIDYAVICSEMGAHISPCGRMLVVCVASLYQDGVSAGQQSGFNYELRVISLEALTFGEVLQSRSISAGHCLTSVQFSPGSDMILLSYGRKHTSLLRHLQTNEATVVQIHTLLELYSTKTLTLVRVMHSGEDEANTALFHPFPGEGIIYGTKTGKLRILRHRRTNSNGDGGEINCYENELLEVSEDDSG